MTIHERKQVGTAVHVWTSERGSFRSERLVADVIVFRAIGYLEKGFFGLFKAMVDETMAECRPHLFWDGEQMTGYESALRARIGDYCVAVKARVATMNVFTPNPLVAMGAAVINVWLGGFFTVFHDREAFEARLRATRFGSAR